MLDYSFLPGPLEESLSVVKASINTTMPMDSNYQRNPNHLRFLGLSIDRPRPKQMSRLIREVEEDAESISSSCRMDEYSVTDIGKELDETMSVIESKISELVKLDNDLRGNSGELGINTNLPATGCDYTTGICEVGLNEENLSSQSSNTYSYSKLESLIETSFRITERIRTKVYTTPHIMNAVTTKDIKTNTKVADSHTNDTVKVGSHSQTKQGSLNINNTLAKKQKEDQNRTSSSKRNSLPKPRTLSNSNYHKTDVKESANDDKISATDDMVPNDSYCSADSPISCCFKESESTFISHFKSHPLENLFKDRSKTSKVKSKRRRVFSRLLDCKKRLTVTDDTIACSETEMKNKALNAFINRRRSLNVDENRGNRGMQDLSHDGRSTFRSSKTTCMDKANVSSKCHLTDKNSTYNEGEVKYTMETQCSTKSSNNTLSSKHKLLQTLRFKKGLISVTSLTRSLAEGSN